MRYIILTLLLALLIGCPKPVEELDPAICDDGYHPCGVDSQECCLDTTNYTFTWAFDTLGVYGSHLNDVSIINSDNIWAVGLIYMNDPDSTFDGTGRMTFNVAHWDGIEWEMTRATTANDYVRELDCIYAFSESDIWFGDGGLPLHWNGSEFYLFTPAQGEHPGQPSINGIWGTSSENIYFVGDAGSIVHYNGSSFLVMDSQTDVDLIGISGSTDGNHVFSVGFSNPEALSIVLERENLEWNSIYYFEGVLPTTGNMGSLYKGLDVLGHRVYFSTTLGIWEYEYYSDETIMHNAFNPSLLGIQRIRAQSINDVALFNTYTTFIHYNGQTWNYDNAIRDVHGSTNAICRSADYVGDLTISVGELNPGSLAFIARGYRN